MSIHQTVLDNGLQLSIREMHTAPVVSFWVWYRVGTRNEHQGITGISHWVEHMLFKGTDRWPSGAADHAISRQGGTYNGMTWYDFTAFYETLPIASLDLALDIEADRMQHARFLEQDVESERSVVISERQGSENSPLFLLAEEVSSAAFRVHPYGHETIGHLCDLEAITAEELRHHYDTYYTPNNAVIAVSGAVRAQEVAEAVARQFGTLPAGPQPPPVRAVEPRQRGERRVTVQGAGTTDYLEIAYHVPAATHPDFHAITVLNAILSGGSGFAVGRGHITNHTSRLYRALVEREITVDVYGSLTPTLDPGLYRLSATGWPGADLDEVIVRIDEELARVQDSPVSEAELAKAQRQARALFAYSSESISDQAFWQGLTAMFADYTWFEQYLDQLAAVTTADVQRVAQTYLDATQRTIGSYIGNQKEA